MDSITLTVAFVALSAWASSIFFGNVTSFLFGICSASYLYWHHRSSQLAPTACSILETYQGGQTSLVAAVPSFAGYKWIKVKQEKATVVNGFPCVTLTHHTNECAFLVRTARDLIGQLPPNIRQAAAAALDKLAANAQDTVCVAGLDGMEHVAETQHIQLTMDLIMEVIVHTHVSMFFIRMVKRFP